MFLEAVLSNAGYGVLTAENGVRALEVMDKEHVDLVVLDIMLPGMDGFAVCAKIRERSNTPILIVYSIVSLR